MSNNTVNVCTKPKLVMLISQDSFFLNHFIGYARVASDCGFEVIVLTSVTSPVIKNKIESSGYKVVGIDIKRSATSPIRLVLETYQIAKFYKELGASVVHQFGTKSILLGTIACIINGTKVKIINNLTGLGIVFAKKNVKNQILRTAIIWGMRLFLNPKGSKVVCENLDDIVFFVQNKSLRQSDAVYIPGTGIDTNRFKPQNIREEVLTVVMASRLLKSKGTRVFLQASEILYKKHLNVNMWLLGDCDKSNSDSLTEKEIAMWREKKCCKIFGYVEDVAPMLGKAHIFVLPSWYREGLPRCLLEAAASGLAIITTDVVGCRDVVKNENGILIPTHDPKSLARAIEGLLNNKSQVEFMGRKSREYAMEKWSNRVIFAKLKSLYVDFLQSK